MKIDVPRLKRVKGRWYWRPTPAVQALGFSLEALGTDDERAIRRALELNAAVEVERERRAAPSVAAESIAALIRRYREMPRWQRLAPATRRAYGNILDEIERRAGKLLVRSIDRRGLVETYEKLQPRGLAIAAAHMRVWRIILGYAWNIGWRDDNPAKGLLLVTPESRRRVWAPEEVAAFRAAAEQEGRASIALAVELALDLGQREGDVLRLLWSDFEGGAFTIHQQKTSATVVVPVSPALRTRLDATPRNAVQVIVSEATRRPYRSDHFRHEFARIRALAGLPDDLQFRDLRRTAATELGAAGATDDEIRAVTGHRSRGVVAVYVRPDGRFAAAAQEKRLTKSRTKGGGEGGNRGGN